MQIIDITKDNIAGEHICCAMTEKKTETCVHDKRAWLTARFDDGLVFKRLDARGKVFIEYIPAEKAWYPIDAPGYMHIDCFWVAGSFKGQGYGSQLLEACMADAREKGRKGLTVIAGTKKTSFLSDGKFLKKKGFQVADTALPGLELLYLPFADDAPKPAFRSHAKEAKTDEEGMVLYYTNQCPFAHTYALRIRDAAQARGRTLTLHHMVDAETAQQCPSPCATYSFFYNGAFVTNEIFSPAKFEAFLDEHP